MMAKNKAERDPEFHPHATEDYQPYDPNLGDTPIEHRGGPASGSGRAVQESSEKVRAEEMGVTGTRESTLAGLAGTAPVVDHDKAAADEAARQEADDNRRRKAREAEAKYQAAMDEVHKASSPQFDDDGNPRYNDLGYPLDADGNVVEEHPAEVEDKRKRL